MLYLDRLRHELESCRDTFRSYGETRREDAARYGARLSELARHTASEIKQQIGDERAPGSLPSDELDSHRSISVEFPSVWRSHEESRRWALDALGERATFAADGTQIMPGRDVSVPVAVVQVAHFENRHRRAGEYIKDVNIEVITPDELLTHDAASTLR